MIDLNSRDVLKELDPKGMLELIEGFPAQCREALGIGAATTPPTLSNRPGIVALAGMGGSAAGGDFVKALFERHGAAPFVVVRDYDLPSYVGVGDVVFIASYSGNTEETLSVYEQAKKSGATIIAVTSGGKLKADAEAHGFTVYTVPGGNPPRASLGYMLMPVLSACVGMKLLPELDFAAAFSRLDEVSADYGIEGGDAFAKETARKLQGKIGVCYGLGLEAGLVANRWRCQFNENAKYLLFDNAFPELCHNEIMGWVAADRQGDRFAGVILSFGDESERMKTRAQVTARVISDKVEFTTIVARGETAIEKLLSLTYIGDWISLYVARLNGVDPVEIANIDTLKEELAKLD